MAGGDWPSRSMPMALGSNRREVTQEEQPQVSLPSNTTGRYIKETHLGDKHRMAHLDKRPMHRAQSTVFSHTGIDNISTNLTDFGAGAVGSLLVLCKGRFALSIKPRLVLSSFLLHMG